jgi:hypothetical protein
MPFADAVRGNMEARITAQNMPFMRKYLQPQFYSFKEAILKAARHPQLVDLPVFAFLLHNEGLIFF